MISIASLNTRGIGAIYGALGIMWELSFSHLSIYGALVACFGLGCIFVLSLYAVDPGLPRDHPTTIRRRVTAILCISLAAPCYLWLWSDKAASEGTPLPDLLGIKWAGLPQALVYPLLLVIVLYAGPIFQHVTSDEPWYENERKDIIFRNYVVAPLAEELVFRGCMVPLLLPSLGITYTIVLCPLFFGIAHVHHLVEWARRGDGSVLSACITVLVQVCYTSIYGMFSAFLLLRTGHLVSAIVTHAFCNTMGFPDFGGVRTHHRSVMVGVAYIVGLVSFSLLLVPFTEPSLYVYSQ